MNATRTTARTGRAGHSGRKGRTRTAAFLIGLGLGFVTLFAGAALTAPDAAAQVYGPRAYRAPRAQRAHARPIEERQLRQQARILEGLRSGTLTPREARRLEAGQRRIERMQWRAARDGVVTPREWLRLERALDRETRAITRLTTNARVRMR